MGAEVPATGGEPGTKNASCCEVCRKTHISDVARQAQYITGWDTEHLRRNPSNSSERDTTSIET